MFVFVPPMSIAIIYFLFFIHLRNDFVIISILFNAVPTTTAWAPISNSFFK